MAGILKDGGGDDDLIADINVTPLVDVVLVLLIIFMVTATYIVRPSINVDLPGAANAEDTVQTTLSLVVTREGSLYLNGEKIEHAALQQRVPPMLAENPELQAIIAADENVRHGDVVRVVDAVKGLGVKRFAINTEREFRDAASPQ